MNFTQYYKEHLNQDGDFTTYLKEYSESHIELEVDNIFLLPKLHTMFIREILNEIEANPTIYNKKNGYFNQSSFLDIGPKVMNYFLNNYFHLDFRQAFNLMVKDLVDDFPGYNWERINECTQKYSEKLYQIYTFDITSTVQYQLNDNKFKEVFELGLKRILPLINVKISPYWYTLYQILLIHSLDETSNKNLTRLSNKDYIEYSIVNTENMNEIFERMQYIEEELKIQNNINHYDLYIFFIDMLGAFIYPDFAVESFEYIENFIEKLD
ncbi:hypothetical protein KPL39_14970 [Clostridium gasigenes]|uniref:hypothetical protein n=1 Tax=Clostridium gasigenes TaxID=94869 RepID=UPI001C0AE54D|nr:hypothetical protein [Clostridium gasigenes]MBU3137565.1 hypothetical protein [Clostridium gasigenes]